MKTTTLFMLAFTLLLAASSMLSVESTSAQPTSKPVMPEFTMKYVDNSYDIPPTYTTDPYTGGNVSSNGSGEHIDDRNVVFTIKNQPFTSYTDTNGKAVNLYYNFRFKGYYSEEWRCYPFNGNMTTHSYGIYTGGPFKYYPASTDEYTIFSIKLSTLTAFDPNPGIPYGATVDFEVQAQVGHIDDIPSGLMAGDFYSFTGKVSDWSSTQTITVTKGNTTPAPTAIAATPAPTAVATPTEMPTETPVQAVTQADAALGLSWEQIVIAIMAVTIAVLTAGLIVFWHKQHRK